LLPNVKNKGKYRSVLYFSVLKELRKIAKTQERIEKRIGRIEKSGALKNPCKTRVFQSISVYLWGLTLINTLLNSYKSANGGDPWAKKSQLLKDLLN